MTIGAEILFIVTAYAAGCGGSGLTRFGERFPHHERTVAVDPHIIPRFAALAIEGVGIRYAEDTGRVIVGHRIDVFMESCKAAREFGVQRLHVLRLPDGMGK